MGLKNYALSGAKKVAWKDEPKNVIVDFLRTRLTDPRSRAETTETDTFSGTGASQTLTLTPSSSYSAYCITDVSVRLVFHS